MTHRIPIEFQLRADVNGHTFDMNGDGWGDASTGECQLSLSAAPAFPQGFDPKSCPMICSHPTSSFFSRPAVSGESFAELSGGGYDVEPSRVGNVWDENGELLLDLRVTSKVSLVDGILRSDHKMTGFSHLPRLSHNVMTADDMIVSAGPGKAVATTSWTMIAFDSAELRGLCTIPYELVDTNVVIPPMARTVESLDVTWDGGPDVVASYRTCIRALTDVTMLLEDVSATPV